MDNLSIYLRRWSIEVIFKDLKQYFGYDQIKSSEYVQQIVEYPAAQVIVLAFMKLMECITTWFQIVIFHTILVLAFGFYNSIGNFTSCSITENDYQGISIFRVSNVTIQKDPNIAAYYRNCFIANNGMQEISFVNSTNLFADRDKNVIVDNSFTLGTFDKYLVYCPNMEVNRWFA